MVEHKYFRIVVKKILFAAFTASVILSCQSESEFDSVNLMSHNIVVSLPNKADTTVSRVVITDKEQSVELNWESGDAFAIYTTSGEIVAEYIFSSKNDEDLAIFTTTNNSALIDGEEYIAVYPFINDIYTIEEHRSELECRLLEQTQEGNSNNNHLSYALHMESNFTYEEFEITNIQFEYKIATRRISFETYGGVPSKIIYQDGDYMDYILYFENMNESDTYTANFVLKPSICSESREVIFSVFAEDEEYANNIFSINTNVAYYAGVQYRSALSLSDVSMYIYTEDDLVNFSTLVNSGNSDIDAILMSNLDLNNTQWSPIGNEDYPYKGCFDGNGYTISNLVIDSNSNCQGLFGRINGGSIKNLTLMNPQIKAIKYVGAICGYMRNGTIESCYVDGGSISGYYFIGGIIGSTSEDNYRYYITDCHNTGDVSGVSNIGGIIGYGYSYYSSYILECSNIGNISGSSSSFGLYIGGIAGSLYADYCYGSNHNISNCCNNGDIYGYEYIGGIVGNLTTDWWTTGFYWTMTYCHNTGQVEGVFNNIGGIAGYSYYIPIELCYNLGLIIGEKYVGGIVGYIENAPIENCYNTGEISDGFCLGGIAGYVYNNKIKFCYNIGNINGEGGGGIVGSIIISSNVIDCYYSYDSILNCTNSIGTCKTVSEMLSTDFVLLLNSDGNNYWATDSELKNGGYPVLVDASLFEF